MDFNFVSSQIWFSRERNRLCGGIAMVIKVVIRRGMVLESGIGGGRSLLQELVVVSLGCGFLQRMIGCGFVSFWLPVVAR
ncbi:unnamed protein product [Arabidopsis lyrata]|nr:unnamed protein product [Arabidopsis lyrata]